MGLGVAAVPDVGARHHPAELAVESSSERARVRRPQDAGTAAYTNALSLMRARDFAGALAAFQAFLTHHPEHPYSGNAVYWAGEVHYAQRSYVRAIRQFQRVLSRHPASSKVPDSLFKIGLCHMRMGDGPRAREFFERVQRRYPDSVAARLASQEDAS